MRDISHLIGSLLLSLAPALLPTAAAENGTSAEPPVEVSPVIVRAVESSQTVVGTVEPARRSLVGSAVDGRVVSFPVENGDRVAAGDVLAQLRTETLEWELATAKAELDLREQELVELKNGSDPDTIDNLEAQMKAAASQRDYTESQLARIESLYKRGQAATRNQLDEARSQATSALQEYIAAKSLYDQAVRGPREERIAQAEARCEMQRAVIRRLEDQITRHTIFAPFDGFVVSEHTEVGQWASSGDPIAEVVQLSEVNVRANVLEGQVMSLRIGQPVQVIVSAAPQREWQGTVHRIIPQADVRSRTFPVEIRIANRVENDVPVLKAGYLASVRLASEKTRETVLVPKDALVFGGEQTVVYVADFVSDDEQLAAVRPVPVSLGVSDGATIQAHGDLSPDDRVVVEGNERLQPGQRVRVIEEVAYD